MWDRNKFELVNFQNISKKISEQRLIDLQTEIPNKFEESVSYEKESTDYDTAIISYNKNIKNSSENTNTNRLLISVDMVMASNAQPLVKRSRY